MTGDGPPRPTARAGTCAIVGLPNVGKSTLLNHAEIAFIDTPGLQDGRGPLRQFMRDEALDAAAACDVALLVVDATDRRGRMPARLGDDDAVALARVVGAHPVVIALNKIDRVAKPDLLPVIAAWAEWRPDAEVIPISAALGDGLDVLEAAIARRLPVGPALFPEDMVTDRAERFIAAELIREQLYLQLGQELPYACAVQIETWDERPARRPAGKPAKAGKPGKAAAPAPNELSIGAVIVVERDSQKAIVVGRAGSRIKELGIAARAALSESMERPVHLTLFVKVLTEWSRTSQALAELGYHKP